MGVKTPCTLWSRQPQAVFTSNPKPNLSVPLGGGHDKATLAVGALNSSTDASCWPVSPQLSAGCRCSPPAACFSELGTLGLQGLLRSRSIASCTGGNGAKAISRFTYSL